ncbi:hypothetical protein NPIL_298001, partial [Nephila pilipes]
VINCNGLKSRLSMQNLSAYYHGLRETCRDYALPYRRVAQWIEAFCSGQNDPADLYRKGRLSIPQQLIEIMKSLLSRDFR